MLMFFDKSENDHTISLGQISAYPFQGIIMVVPLYYHVRVNN